MSFPHRSPPSPPDPSPAPTRSPADADLVSAVGWTQTNVLFSVSDDKSVQSWNIDGEPQSKVCDVDCFATDFHWLVAPGAADSEMFAIGAGDGAHAHIDCKMCECI